LTALRTTSRRLRREPRAESIPRWILAAAAGIALLAAVALATAPSRDTAPSRGGDSVVLQKLPPSADTAYYAVEYRQDGQRMVVEYAGATGRACFDAAEVGHPLPSSVSYEHRFAARKATLEMHCY
jgi:hypothetical protein